VKQLDKVFQDAILSDFYYIYDTEVTEELLKILGDARMRALALGDTSEAERNQVIGYAHGVAEAIQVVHRVMQTTFQDETD